MKTRWIPICIASFALFAAADDVQAVAFRCHNQTELKFRIRIFDDGAWLRWTEMPSKYWDAPARKVKRTKHKVEIEVWTTKKGADRPEWVTFYQDQHESRALTRVIHLYQDKQGHIVTTWYDEPPGCRGKPTWDGQKTHHDCLTKSGWTEKLLKEKAVKEIENTTIKAIFAGA